MRFVRLKVGDRVRLKYIGIEVTITEIEGIGVDLECAFDDETQISAIEDDDGRPAQMREWWFTADDIDDNPDEN